MNIAPAFESAARRRGLLVALIVPALLTVAVAWISATPATAATMALLWVTVLVLVKGVFELASNQRVAQASLASDLGRASQERHDILELLNALDAAAADQQKASGVLIDEVRAVEETLRSHANRFEAAAERLRALEAAVGRWESDRALIDRVRVLEARNAPRQPPPGQAQRLASARKLIAASEPIVADWHAAHEAVTGVDSETKAPASNGLPAADAPMVTVVIACHNEERFVGEALESIRRQSHDDWECIIVDDGSTDQSARKIEDYTNKDARFRLIRLPENRGIAVARNVGIEAARGSYLQFLDADDLLMSASLEDRIATITGFTDPDIAGAYCGVRIIDEAVVLDDLPDREQWQPGVSVMDFVSAEGECPFTIHAPLVRADVVRAHHGFDESIASAEDWDLWLHIMRSGFVFMPTAVRSAVYRQKMQSSAKTGATRHIKVAQDLINSVYREWDNKSAELLASYPFPHPLPQYQSLLTVASRAIQYASTAILRGDLSAADEILASLEPGSWPLIRRHVGLDRKIDEGFRRAAGLDPLDLDALSSELGVLHNAVDAAVRSLTIAD